MDWLAERELDVEIPRVAEDGDEGADSARDPGQGEAEVGPIDLHRRSRREAERQEGFALTVLAQAPEASAQDRDSPGVAERAQALQDGGSEHLGRIVEERTNGLLVGIEERAPRRRRRLGRRAVSPQDLAHGLA
jgi:hypothetical protein